MDTIIKQKKSEILQCLQNCTTKEREKIFEEVILTFDEKSISKMGKKIKKLKKKREEKERIDRRCTEAKEFIESIQTINLTTWHIFLRSPDFASGKPFEMIYNHLKNLSQKSDETLNASTELILQCVPVASYRTYTLKNLHPAFLCLKRFLELGARLSPEAVSKFLQFHSEDFPFLLEHSEQKDLCSHLEFGSLGPRPSFNFVTLWHFFVKGLSPQKGIEYYRQNHIGYNLLQIILWKLPNDHLKHDLEFAKIFANRRLDEIFDISFAESLKNSGMVWTSSLIRDFANSNSTLLTKDQEKINVKYLALILDSGCDREEFKKSLDLDGQTIFNREGKKIIPFYYIKSDIMTVREFSFADFMHNYNGSPTEKLGMQLGYFSSND